MSMSDDLKLLKEPAVALTAVLIGLHALSVAVSFVASGFWLVALTRAAFDVVLGVSAVSLAIALVLGIIGVWRRHSRLWGCALVLFGSNVLPWLVLLGFGELAGLP